MTQGTKAVRNNQRFGLQTYAHPHNNQWNPGNRRNWTYKLKNWADKTVRVSPPAHQQSQRNTDDNCRTKPDRATCKGKLECQFPSTLPSGALFLFYRSMCPKSSSEPAASFIHQAGHYRKLPDHQNGKYACRAEENIFTFSFFAYYARTAAALLSFVSLS